MFQICRVAVCAGTPRFPLRAIGDRGAGIVTDRRTATWPVAERAPVTAFILSPAVESVCPEWHCWHLGPDTGHSSHPIPSHPIPSPAAIIHAESLGGWAISHFAGYLTSTQDINSTTHQTHHGASPDPVAFLLECHKPDADRRCVQVNCSRPKLPAIKSEAGCCCLRHQEGR